jgi:DNA-binding phage protein
MKNAIETAVGVLLSRRGMTLPRLAGEVGLSYSALYRRLGEEVPTRDTAELCATGLGMTLGEFVAAVHEEYAAARKAGWAVDEPVWRVNGVEPIPEVM